VESLLAQGYEPSSEGVQLMEIQPKDVSKGHFYVSLVKSGLRIAAGFFFVLGDVVGAGCLLIGAEILGILEEVV
jgi:hypothetical protein